MLARAIDKSPCVPSREYWYLVGTALLVDSSNVDVMVVVVAGSENTPREFQLPVACLACRS